MNKIKRPQLFIAVLLAFNLLLLFRLNSNNNYINELKQGIVKINENHISSIGKVERLVANIETGFIDSGKEIINFDSQLFGEKDLLLVLRIHENNCNDCVKQSLIYLNDIIKEKRDTSFNIAISTSYNNLDILRQDFDVKFLPVQQDIQLNLDIDFTSQPYVFLVSRNGRVSNIFVPEFDSMELFVAYLQSISSIGSTVL
mgnify:CR=1 FL=1